MSPCLSDFSSVSGRSVRLRVADRVHPILAKRANYRRNRLGMKKGLYHPKLGMRLTSVKKLKRDSKRVVFDSDNDEIIDKKTGTVFDVFEKDGLPSVEVQFDNDDKENLNEESDEGSS